MFNLTREQIQAVFVEWETERRKNPDEFAKHEDLTIEECAESQTEYFIELLHN